MYFDDFYLWADVVGQRYGLSKLSVVTTGGATVAASFNTAFVGNVVSFTVSGNGDNNNHLVRVYSNSISCFCVDTCIDTPDGPIAVQDLTAGTKILRADGGTTTVQWLGTQTIAPRFVHPAKVNPIRISAGALGDNIPAHDLDLSPDHAVAIDGFLINAGALVNDTTIRQRQNMPLDGFTYYHVETDTHERILAEGCAVESYLDDPRRDAFDNGNERADAPAIQEMDLPRISTRRLVPQEISARLLEHAAEQPEQRRTA